MIQEWNPNEWELIPINDRAIVVRDKTETVSKGGIILADAAQEKPQLGTVLAIGDGVLDDAGIFRPTVVKAGERILFAKWGGTEVSLPDGTEILMMRESDILGRFVKKTKAK